MGNFRLNQSELLSLVILFELGSAVVVGLGMGAKQDAWLAIFIGLVGGCILFFVYHLILKDHPKLTIIEILQQNLGKSLGKIISIAYSCYFIYIAARVLRDFSELLNSSVLNETPSIAILTIFSLLIAYALYLGIEVIGRSAPVFFTLTLTLWLIFLVAVFISNQFKLTELMPILEFGWKPVVKTSFPQTTTFPFGEMIVFMMIALNVPKEVSFLKTGLLGMVLSGIILMITITINIGINGVTKTSESLFPLLLTVSKVKLGDFINRLDPIVIAILIIGGFFKVAIFQWGALQALTRSLGIISYKKLIVPLVTLSTIIALGMANNFAEHIHIGLKIVPMYLHIPFQIIFPFILIVTIKLRRKQKEAASKG